MSPATGPGGLTTAEVEAARRAGHTNESAAATSRSFREILRANLLTRFNLLLVALGAVILVVGPLKDAMFVGVVVANAAIGIAQEYRASRTLDQLRLLTAPTVQVWRDGTPRPIATADLVLGDVIEVGRGDQLPVDGDAVAVDALELDTSLLTGEAEPTMVVEGATVRAGTIVVAGTGVIRATAVGSQRLASQIEAEARRFDLAPSDLRNTTDRLLGIISWAIAIIGPLLVLRQAFGPESWQESVRTTVAGMVAMIPEGLVLLTSATLALGAIRLGRRRVLTQELSAIELLARVDLLCLDKTGTITTGQPSVTAVEPVGDGAGFDGARFDGAGFDGTGFDGALVALAALAHADPNPNLTLAAVRARYPQNPGWEVTELTPFSSRRRWGGAAFGDHGTWVLGAPDVLDPATEVAAAAEGNRVVALARVRGALDPTGVPDAEIVALVVLAEQVRPTAPATLAYLDDQGVTVKVISGDLPATVGRVLESAGRPTPRVVDGRDLPSDDAAVAAMVLANDVVGRVEPHGKQQMVRAFRAEGLVVGMTGDGVNDVLALKEADLGMAMGSGAAATRAVAELILLDDDFDVVPEIVDEGRRVLANVERVAVFFLSKTVWACLLAALVVVTGMPYPLYASQATLIGFLAIGTPAFLLSFRHIAPRARPGILDRVVRRALPTGIAAGTAGAAAFAVVHYGLDEPTAVARTAATLTLAAVSIVVVALNLGPEPGRWRLLVPAMAVVGVGIVTIEPLRNLFSLETLTDEAAVAMVVSTLGGSLGVVAGDRWARRSSTPATGAVRPL